MPDSLVSCAPLPPVDWQPWSRCTGRDELAIFRCSLSIDNQHFTWVESVLQPEELDRARRYHRPDDQHRSALARGLLRIVAGRYLRVPPAQVRFLTGPTGKLTLDHAGGLHLNVSHAGNWIGLVVGHHPVGIDVERIDPGFDFQSVSAYSFGAEENHQLSVSADPRTLFYQLWTRKEALVKATGRGIDDDFCQIPALDGEHRISVERAGGAAAWLTRSFWLADAYPAAVVYPPIRTAPVFYTIDARLFDTDVLPK